MTDRIKIVQSDITALTTDCVVNAANEALAEGSGVCGAIFAAAGSDELTAACRRIGGCKVGSAVITPGFRMKAKYIIHAVGPHWHGGNAGEKKLLYSCYQAAMKLAQEYGCRSIGFPLISAGVFHYPLEQAWQTAVDALLDYFVQNPDCGISVVFAVRDPEKMKPGQAILDGMTTENTDAPKAGTEKRSRIYVADMGQFKDPACYEFVAEFADPKIAGNYLRYMRGKKRYSKKDIILKEVDADASDPTAGKLECVCSALGEYIVLNGNVMN